MLALELLGNGENRPKVHADEIKKAIDSLQNESHKVIRCVLVIHHNMKLLYHDMLITNEY